MDPVCDQCFHPLPPQAKFCIACGKKLEINLEEGGSPPAPPPLPTPVEEQQYFAGQSVVPQQAYIPNYLVQSILVTVFCCIPFGIPAIIFASQVNSKQMSGDFVGAQKSSQTAKKWCWAAFWTGAVVQGILFFIQIAAVLVPEVLQD